MFYFIYHSYSPIHSIGTALAQIDAIFFVVVVVSSHRDCSHSCTRHYLFAIPFYSISGGMLNEHDNHVVSFIVPREYARASARATNKTLFNNWAIFKLFMWNTLMWSVLLMRCNAEFSMWQSDWWLESSKQHSAAQLKNKCTLRRGVCVCARANWYRSMHVDGR